ncbi:MAG: chromosome segregation protein SMC [Oscillospiraceae bacterium]|nr:chromosome segregation protein SMC [Oscillospiraceae bacterium]
MLLKRLEMQGFKSFVDKTVLDFVEGSTAVVGPNGSGKSNISDAIRWVIGEMSAKSLRGTNMQDVIFAGTETRKPVNFAEVSLVLDNSARIFNIDYDELVVTRRLFRSGESVYQINRANCRLKDIHELFMDTGLGRDGYSIIGQGNVSQILSTKAEDRRSLFEEAAGISKYKYRKEEAQRKLKGVEENLVRIGDITSELEGQRAPLKKQSEKARKYLTYYEEYKALDVNMSLITIDKNKAAAEEAQHLYESVREELNEKRKTENETQLMITDLSEESRQKDRENEEKNNLLRQTESESMSASKDISVAQTNIKNNHTMIERIDNEIQSINDRNTQKKQEIEQIKTQITEKEAEAQEILKVFDSVNEDQGKLTEKKDSIAEEIENLKADAVEKLNLISSKKAQISGMETLRQSFIERRETLNAEIKSFNEGVLSTKQDIEQCEKDIKQKSEKLDKMKSTVERHTSNLNELKSQAEETSRKLNEINVDYNSKASKKRILEGMENDYAGYAKSVKTVLKSDELKRLSVYGTVSGLIDVDKKYVIAIESALGGAMQNIVVESEEDAKEAILYLRKTGSGRATFLPVTSVRGRELDNAGDVKDCTGFVGLASTLVKYDRKYDGIIKSLLGRVVVVDNVDNAIAMSRKFGYKFRVVTLEGDILNAGGSMSGGSVNKQSGFLSRAAEIKTLAAELTELSRLIREHNDEKQKIDGDITMINNQLSSYESLVREYEDEIIRLRSTLEHLNRSIESGDETQQNHSIELNQIETQLSESSDEIALLLQNIRTLEKEADELQNRTESLTEEFNRISDEKDEKTSAIMDKTMELASIEKDIKTLQARIETLEQEISLSHLDIETHKQEKEKICQENDNLYTLVNDKKQLIEKINKESESVKQRISEIKEEKAHIEEKIQNIRSSNSDLTDDLLKLGQEMSRLENRVEKLNTDTENIMSRLWDDYELTYTTAQEVKTDVQNEKEAFSRLSELKKLIKDLGSVNMDAIEEYKNVEERFKFLSEQKADLDKSKADLNEIISSMEELMQEHFGKHFAQINESFGMVFKELFGGGKAKLYLSEPDNVLESGIEIEVQLPGKGLQNINLYSGGEKSFIAIALLFAILRVKPAPFCILDEIDAALDDVNVSRFATYLKNYIEHSQFIVITHRRGTMEAANILYGVTMQEKGVSKLLSLHIDDIAEDMAS